MDPNNAANQPCKIEIVFEPGSQLVEFGSTVDVYAVEQGSPFPTDQGFAIGMAYGVNDIPPETLREPIEARRERGSATDKPTKEPRPRRRAIAICGCNVGIVAGPRTIHGPDPKRRPV
jgi:hypothetical protein